MGLTHHWERPTELPADRFAAAVHDVHRAIMATEIPVAGFEGVGDPIFRNDAIIFNGAAPEACEPFEIHQTEFDHHGRPCVFSFCKTQHCRYDFCVRVALVVLKCHLENVIQVGSDEPDDAWTEARQFCVRLLGFGHEFRLRGK